METPRYPKCEQLTMHRFTEEELQEMSIEQVMALWAHRTGTARHKIWRAIGEAKCDQIFENGDDGFVASIGSMFRGKVDHYHTHKVGEERSHFIAGLYEQGVARFWRYLTNDEKSKGIRNASDEWRVPYIDAMCDFDKLQTWRILDQATREEIWLNMTDAQRNRLSEVIDRHQILLESIRLSYIEEFDKDDAFIKAFDECEYEGGYITLQRLADKLGCHSQTCRRRAERLKFVIRHGDVTRAQNQ